MSFSGETAISGRGVGGSPRTAGANARPVRVGSTPRSGTGPGPFKTIAKAVAEESGEQKLATPQRAIPRLDRHSGARTARQPDPQQGWERRGIDRGYVGEGRRTEQQRSGIAFIGRPRREVPAATPLQQAQQSLHTVQALQGKCAALTWKSSSLVPRCHAPHSAELKRFSCGFRRVANSPCSPDVLVLGWHISSGPDERIGGFQRQFIKIIKHILPRLSK